MAEKLQVLPDAERIVSSLRDTGYSFAPAVADIVDNSIAADAKNIIMHIDMDLDGEIEISIADDGIGMNRDTLISAMKYGSPRRDNPASLGKFGLGLKTASTSYCRLLQVTARDSTGKVLRASWDLDHIAKVNSWELMLDQPDKETLRILDEAAHGKTGTLVAWKKVDRLLPRNYKTPGGGHAKNALQKQVDELRFELGLIFQRYISPKPEWKIKNPVRIVVNGDVVPAQDPFYEGVAEVLAEKTYPVEINDDAAGEFTVRAYVLPRTEDIPAGTPIVKVATKYQGIYVYRQNRLLRYGDWLEAESVHNMKNQARAEFNFDYRLDEAFRVPVDKSAVELDPAIIEVLQDLLKAPLREAEKRREVGVRKRKDATEQEMHTGSNKVISEKEPEVPGATFEIKNPATGEVEVTKTTGETVRVKIPNVAPRKEGEFYIQTAETLPDGILYEPVIMNKHQGVMLNRNHDYYRKVYLPNRMSGVAIQGMDSLIWALCRAELNTCTAATVKVSKEIRYEVSRILRTLVEDLPDIAAESDDE